MKIDALVLGKACAAATAIIWVLCSILVTVLPGSMMTLSGHMMHADLAEMAWTMSLTGFAIGLVIWTVVAFAGGWLIGVLYNRFAAA